MHLDDVLASGYGALPDPIAFAVAAEFASRAAACRWSAEEAFGRLISGFWAGEFERGGRSFVFTPEPPEGAWVCEDGSVRDHSEEDEAPNLPTLHRERLYWARADVLKVLSKWDRKFVPPDDASSAQIYAELSFWPLERWSGFSRRMIWERLCISTAHLEEWARRVSYSSDSANAAPHTIAIERSCERWLCEMMMLGPPAKPKALYRNDAARKWPGLAKRGFNRAWSRAIDSSRNLAWKMPGPKR